MSVLELRYTVRSEAFNSDDENMGRCIIDSVKAPYDIQQPRSRESAGGISEATCFQMTTMHGQMQSASRNNHLHYLASTVCDSFCRFWSPVNVSLEYDSVG
jgi:hypothetical protein